MSLFIDVKYLKLLSPRLPLFKEKGRNVWTCRCVLCGDSKKKKTKVRGYFYTQKNSLYYKCHNCGASMHFGTFLKDLDPGLYQQFVFDRYSEGEGGRPNAHAKAEPMMKQDAPVFDIPQVFHLPRVLTMIAPSLDTLPEDNEAVQYCIKRKIPRAQWHRLRYLEHTKHIVRIFPEYGATDDSIGLSKSEEPRLVISFVKFSPSNLHPETPLTSLSGVAMRALRDKDMRYINLRSENVDDDYPMLFGMKEVDRTKPILVLEGAIDSLFLPNAIAVAGTSFGKLEEVDLPKDKLTIVFDNEPRNYQVCKLLERYILKGYKVCIWPNDVKGKDINEMVLNGLDPATLITNNTYEGLMAELKFAEWKKC